MYSPFLFYSICLTGRATGSKGKRIYACGTKALSCRILRKIAEIKRKPLLLYSGELAHLCIRAVFFSSKIQIFLDISCESNENVLNNCCTLTKGNSSWENSSAISTEKLSRLLIQCRSGEV